MQVWTAVPVSSPGNQKQGYDADLVVFDYDNKFTVEDADQLSKCGWSPYCGTELYGVIKKVFINGKLKYGA